MVRFVIRRKLSDCYVCFMDSRIKKGLDYIENSLGQSLPLNRLAEIACLSPSQFHRLFKSETGSTPFKFVEELKINKAYQKILHENIAVSELSVELGYQDYETFTRAFKKHFFLSPDDLRSVAEEIRSQFDQEQPLEIMFIPAEEDYSEQEIHDKLAQILKEKGLEIDQLPARAYKVRRVADASSKKGRIDARFEIARDQKIWETLIRKKT